VRRGILLLCTILIIAFADGFASERDSLRTALRLSKPNEAQADLFYALGKYYRANNLDSANLFAHKSLQLSKQLNYTHGISKTYILLANIDEFKGDLDNGFENARLAAKSFRADTKYEILYAYQYILATLNRRKAKYGEAMSYYLAALKIAQKNNDLRLEANAYSGMGVNSIKGVNLQSAENFHILALNIRLKLGIDEDIVHSYENLGIVNREKKNYGKALGYYFKALKYIAPDDSSALAFAYNDIGAAYSFQNNLDEAEKYLLLSIKIREHIDEKNELAYTYNYLGENYERQRKFQQAEKAIKKAFLIASEIQNNKQIEEASESLSDFYSRNRRYDSAYVYMVFNKKFRDSLSTLESRNFTARLMAKYQNEKKEKALALTNMQLSERNNELLFAGFGLFVLCTLVVIVIWQAKSKRKKLEEQNVYKLKLAGAEARNQLQEEKLRISRELHDNIGSQLTFINSSIQNLSIDNDALSETRKMTQNTISELRRTVWLINKQEVELDEFVVKLRDYIRPHQAGNPEMKMVVLSQGNCTLNAHAATNLFRIIQESVNNALKYSQASELMITVNCEAGKLDLLVQDNGIGFILSTEADGYGLKNIKARAEALSGTCKFESVVGKGTSLVVQIPI
jgi:signal transduction histidine kinase